jgi:hypothetical protein
LSVQKRSHQITFSPIKDRRRRDQQDFEGSYEQQISLTPVGQRRGSQSRNPRAVSEARRHKTIPGAMWCGWPGRFRYSGLKGDAGVCGGCGELWGLNRLVSVTERMQISCKRKAKSTQDVSTAHDFWVPRLRPGGRPMTRRASAELLRARRIVRVSEFRAGRAPPAIGGMREVKLECTWPERRTGTAEECPAKYRGARLPGHRHRIRTAAATYICLSPMHETPSWIRHSIRRLQTPEMSSSSRHSRKSRRARYLSWG